MDMQDMILVAAIYMKHEESTFEGCIWIMLAVYQWV
jgi:hypothetical protein